MTQRYSDAERRYLAIKEEVKGRAAALDEAVSQSSQVRLGPQSRPGPADPGLKIVVQLNEDM